MSAAAPVVPKPVPTTLMDKVGVYFKEASKTCIVVSFGRKYIHAVEFGPPIAMCEIERDAQLRPVLLAGQPYPIAKAAQRMLDSGLPMYERAETVLRNLIKSEEIPDMETV